MFNNLGDMMKLASEAKKIQEQQEKVQSVQSELLKKIAGTLDQILAELKKR